MPSVLRIIPEKQNSDEPLRHAPEEASPWSSSAVREHCGAWTRHRLRAPAPPRI